MQKLRSVFFILFLFTMVVVVSSCAPKAQNDCGFVQNVYGQRIAWKTNQPVALVVTSSVPIELRSAIYRAAATWKARLGKNVFEIVEENTASGNPGRDRKNGIYFLPNWESDKMSEQGRTSVYWAGDEIQEADIRINAADFSYYNQDPQQLIKGRNLQNLQVAKPDGYSFEALILHEMGHFLGLRHRDRPTDGRGSVMATQLGAYENRTTLAATDTEAISCEYN